MSDQLYEEYSAAIGSVMAARKQYADACENQGTGSWAAEQAQDYLTREVDHRDQIRVRYDSASPGGSQMSRT